MSVIKVENLSKKYLIRHQQRERYTALRDVLANKAKGMFNRGIVQPWKRLANSTVQQINNSTDPHSPNLTFQQSSSSTTEEFWALKDINFEVKRGDRVGIIGRNGAGKTTLLKLLSRITEPTSGRIEITGRVASLLEVGTGFHPELTGRENIFLNGAILGMSKAEIKKKFDEIVAFAEVERFIDTPVKRYSSGMYVRLAFAVAAHLEPEILIVDEVLAVGDAQFQKKCLGKMEEVGKEGRTVLFVSHNMAALSNLCNLAIYLVNGVFTSIGACREIVDIYLNHALDISKIKLAHRTDRQGNGQIKFLDASFLRNNQQVDSLHSGEENTSIAITLRVTRPALGRLFRIDIGINNSMGNRVTWLSSDMLNCTFHHDNNIFVVYFKINKIVLAPGNYSLTFFCSSDNETTDWIQNAILFTVESHDYHGTGKFLPPGQGDFVLDYSISIE